MAKADVGFALIARDSDKTLEACLKSIRPHVKQIVVGIDTLTKDKTERIAKCYADVVFPVKVSDWHECEQHGRVLAQDFARARNGSFAQLDPDLAWHAWIDADDVLEGAELLPRILTPDVPPQVIGFWSKYIYAYVLGDDGRRVPNTVFERERILRTKYLGQPVDWRWEHRVHETVGPANVPHPTWAQEHRIQWVHQHQAHKSESSAPRNLLLLEIELEEHPDDPRTVFYMGNQYFAMAEWAKAAEWYERYAQQFPDGNEYERWQSYVYMSLAYERLGDAGASLQAAFGAIDARPEHPEPYYRLSALYSQMGQDAKAVYWAREGDKKEDAPFFAFKNPMDRSFNKWLPLADSLLRLGHLSEARQCLQEAVNTFPDERVKASLEGMERQEMAERAASAFVETAKIVDEDTMLDLYGKLPKAVKTYGRTRNVAMTVLRTRRKALTQPKIIFWCGRSLEPWAPLTLTTTGIGGSETAVVKIAERFARAGWLVDVYNGADYLEGEYEGVGYWDPERLHRDEECDVFVSWRDPRAHSLPVQARQKVLWCHDLNYGPDVVGDILKWDRVLGVSAWHASMLLDYYDQGGLYVNHVPNGIDLERFAETKKVPFRCVYASSPDRGLDRLLALWPGIHKAEPKSELHVAYGWDNIDKMIAQGRQDLVKFRTDVTRMLEETPGVVWRGRLPQDELARLYCESYLWLYPCDFLEVSCISAMEAMAGGAVPVATRAGALPETVGDAGLLVPGPPQTRAYGSTWPNVAKGVLTDTKLRLSYAVRGIQRAKGFTWDVAFERWLQVLGLDVTQELKEAA